MTIPLNRPSLGDLEAKYVAEAIETRWLTTGRFVRAFEAGMAKLGGKPHAVACSSGTGALWLACQALGIRGRVAVQAYTCDSVANVPLLVTGKPPVILDVEPDTWALDGAALSAALDDTRLGIEAVILAHTYGVPGRDTILIRDLCRERSIPLIEDASEAHGATLNGQPVGSFGDVSIFSCRGEKIISGAQLGAVLTDDPAVARRALQWATNGLPSGVLRYWSTVPGLNLQPSNVHAAIACAQLERQHDLIRARRRVHAAWRAIFAELAEQGLVSFQRAHGEPSWWLTAFDISKWTWLDPRDLGAALLARGIESRPAFYPLSKLPEYGGPDGPACPVSEHLFRSLIVLPSGDGIGEAEQQQVYEVIKEVVGR